MTIQIALMNGYGLAMGSDRHVFRGGNARSEGEEVKIVKLRGVVPAAMMTSGPFAILGQPVARLALRLERAIAAVAGQGRPEALGQAVLDALGEPFDRPSGSLALEMGLPVPSSRLVPEPGDAREEVFVMVGLCCPATGVPVLVAVRAWRDDGQALQIRSRLDQPYEMSWNAGRTVIIAQGTGGGVVQSLVDGLDDDHWSGFAPAERAAVRPAMNARWDRAHARIAVASPRELGGVAAGLVRAAEVLGFLTGGGERSVIDVDTVVLTPRGCLAGGLPAA